MENIIDLHHDIAFFLIIIFTFVSWMLFRIIFFFRTANLNFFKLNNLRRTLNRSIFVINNQIPFLNFYLHIKTPPRTSIKLWSNNFNFIPFVGFHTNCNLNMSKNNSVLFKQLNIENFSSNNDIKRILSFCKVKSNNNNNFLIVNSSTIKKLLFKMRFFNKIQTYKKMQKKYFKSNFSLFWKNNLINKNNSKTLKTYFWKYGQTYGIRILKHSIFYSKKKIYKMLLKKIYITYYYWKNFWENIFHIYYFKLILIKFLDFQAPLLIPFSSTKKLAFKTRFLNKIKSLFNKISTFFKTPSDKSHKDFVINFFKKSPFLLIGFFSQIMSLIFLLNINSEFFIFKQIKPINFFEYEIILNFDLVIMLFIFLNFLCLIIPYIFFSKNYNEKIFYWMSKFFFIYSQKKLVFEFLGPLWFLIIKYGNNFSKTSEEKLNFLKDYLVTSGTELKSLLKTDYFVIDLNIGKEDRLKIIYDLTQCYFQKLKEINLNLNLIEFQIYYDSTVRALLENSNELNSFFMNKKGILFAIHKKIIEPFLLKQAISEEVAQIKPSFWNYWTNNSDPKILCLYAIGLIAIGGLFFLLFKSFSPSISPNSSNTLVPKFAYLHHNLMDEIMQKNAANQLTSILRYTDKLTLEQKQLIVSLFPTILSGVHTKQQLVFWQTTFELFKTNENIEIINFFAELWKPSHILKKNKMLDDLTIAEFEKLKFYNEYILPFKQKFLHIYEILDGVFKWVKLKKG